MSVVICQLGAREHYALARALHRSKLLTELVTDVWAPPSLMTQLPIGRAGRSLRGRYHPDLRDAKVTHYTMAALRRRIGQRGNRGSRWSSIIEFNEWFQTSAAQAARSGLASQIITQTPVVMAYSYAARRILEAGRELGAKSVLCQIDGGYADEQLMCQLHANRGMAYDRAPHEYWDNWREECALANVIVVNSEWSRSLLCSAGIDEKKIIVIPLLYGVPSSVEPSMRNDPRAFSKDQPLRILFLGQLTVRKGFLEAIEAAQLLARAPVHFSFVGGDYDGLAANSPSLPNVTYRGHVPRSEVRAVYEQSDIFLFPTHSDGFGLTQLEALSAGLPVIASRYCGRVVENGRTGCVLDRVSGEEIACAVERFLKNPSLIDEMSKISRTSAAILSSKAETMFLQVVQKMSPEQGRT